MYKTFALLNLYANMIEAIVQDFGIYICFYVVLDVVYNCMPRQAVSQAQARNCVQPSKKCWNVKQQFAENRANTVPAGRCW
jgi:hypothetical protein